MSQFPGDKLDQKVPGATKWNIREPPGAWMAWAAAELEGQLLEIQRCRLRGSEAVICDAPTEPPAAFSDQVVALPESAP